MAFAPCNSFCSTAPATRLSQSPLSSLTSMRMAHYQLRMPLLTTSVAGPFISPFNIFSAFRPSLHDLALAAFLKVM